MIQMTAELIEHMRRFHDVFNDVVPLHEIPSSVSNDELIKAIKESINKGDNILPIVFGYKTLEEDRNIII